MGLKDVLTTTAQEPKKKTAGKKKPAEKGAGRAGKKYISGHFDPEVWAQLQEIIMKRTIAAQKKVSLQELLAEALNDLFKKHGKPPIAK